MDNNFKKVYGELVINFFEECSKKKIEEKIGEKYPSLFVPGVGENYANINPKIMYVGIDNNGWYDLASDINRYKLAKNNEEKINEFLDDVINRASDSLNAKNPFGDWKSMFWNFIFEMQKALYNEYNKKKLGKELEIDDELLKTSFAWGNANAIELYEHVENADKDQHIHNEIKKLSKELDSLYIALQGLELKPDLVIILNWGEEWKYVKMNKVDEDKTQDKEHLHYYLAEENDIKVPIIWTAHPQYLNRVGGFKEYINKIIDLTKEKKIF